MEVNDSQLEVSESKVEKLENAETSSKVDWNQNKRFPRIFPGVILSAVTAGMFCLLLLAIFLNPTTLSKELAVQLVYAFLFLVGLGGFVSAVYWSNCVFKISGLLQYKSSRSRFSGRTSAIIVSLFYNPVGILVCTALVLAVVALIVAFMLDHTPSTLVNPTRAYVFISQLTADILLSAIPTIAIPTFAIGWTYKFFAKLNLVHEESEKRKFIETRMPAIVITTINLIAYLCVFNVLNTTFNSEPESWSEGTWYRLSWTFFATNVVQALNFYILWRCVKDKKSRMSES
jgi:hypothetical protein